MGLGVSPSTYAAEYQVAVTSAFENSPEGTTVLRNLKGIKNRNHWPQILGVGLLGAGSLSFSQGENAKTPVPYLIGAMGAVLYLINSYDYVVIAEPSR